jgi:hypothetical protein
MFRIGPRPSYRVDRSDLQLHAERALAVQPHRLEVRGRPRSLAFPPVCAYCGAPAVERIAVRKAFARPRFHGSGMYGRSVPYRGDIVTSVRIPFCRDCAAQHRATVERISFMRRLRSLFLTPLLVPLAGFTYVFFKTLPAVLDVPSNASAAWTAWGLPAVMVFGFLWCLFIAWVISRSSRIAHQTEITRACDFSDDVSRVFERERHIYAIRDRSFFEAFAAGNHDRVWTEEDDARSDRHMFATLAAIGFAVAAVWLWVVFAP